MDKKTEILRDMKARVAFLNEAAAAYYRDSREIIPNLEYDRLYDELAALEAKTGIVLGASPTRKVGYEVLDSLPKERHAARLLSLDKTKDAEALADWLGDREGLLSWKLDGLTLVLTYRDGVLAKAVTRGNGEVGEVVTANARTFPNLPQRVPFDGELVLRGEALISYSNFQRINSLIPELEAKYKNPRNLCSGSVRQLSTRVTGERGVLFYAFSLGLAEGRDFPLRREQMDFLASLGFDVVEHRVVDRASLHKTLLEFEQAIPQSDLPTDGLVLAFDDIAYGQSLGETSKFPRDAIAFKWRDELRETRLEGIEWSASRTGLINPIAVFEPVELEGTTVSRASVHNVSILEELRLGKGDRITVYKANMIIPQIAENLTKSGPDPLPETCPACGGPTLLKDEGGVRTLYCTNPRCPAKHIKSFAHMASRDALNIEGLSEATIEKFVGAGLLREPADFFRLERHREIITHMEGFGDKSFRNLLKSADKARHTTPARVLYSLGINGIGLANAKLIARNTGGDFAAIRRLDEETLKEMEGIGPVLAASFTEWFRDPDNTAKLDALLEELELEAPAGPAGSALSGLTFVITGSLSHFENREALKEAIEALGGRTAGSVSRNTSFLINNDTASSSAKNKAARELGVPVISEEEFLNRFMTGEQ
jgi:DNA ligase (NAD+)